MSNPLQFDLVKSTQALQFNLQKRNVNTIIPCEVFVAMDVSGSFDDEHQKGYTQTLLNRFVPFSMLFDKDKELNSFAFSSRSTELEIITEHNYKTYIRDEVIGCRGYNGGTEYAPVLEQMFLAKKAVEKTQTVETKSKGLFGLFSKTVSTEEVVSVSYEDIDKKLIFFVTDGDEWSPHDTKNVLNNYLHGKEFVVFLSVSNSKLEQLERYENGKFTSYHNFTFNELHDLQNWSDDKIYDLLLTDNLVNWMSV